MGAFNEWTRGTFLANRKIVAWRRSHHNLLHGAAVMQRLNVYRTRALSYLPTSHELFRSNCADENLMQRINEIT